MAAQRQQKLQYSAGDEPVAAAANAGTAPGDARAKLGRNDPCWCGSGKKFKRCPGREPRLCQRPPAKLAQPVPEWS